jgi:hypothetical protein
VKQIYSNGASALLAASIDDNDLVIQVASGFGALFPNPGADEYFVVALMNPAGDREYIKITSRTSDLLTVPVGGRAQEGSSAQSWTNTLTRVECRVTKGTLDVFLQRGGDTMSGDLDMDGNEIKDAKLTGETVITGGQTVGTAIRGALDDTSNEIVVPSDGSAATMGGAIIIVEGDDTRVRDAAFVIGQIIMWYGALNAIPTGWHLCNGDGGTPDLRNRFIVGSGDSYGQNSTGGAASQSAGVSGAGGAVSAADTGSTSLDADFAPAHSHRVYGWLGVGSDGEHDALGWPGTGISGQRGAQPSGGSFGYTAVNGSGNQLIEENSAGAGSSAHTHTIPGISAHTHSTPAVATIPPYHALAYIMYTG